MHICSMYAYGVFHNAIVADVHFDIDCSSEITVNNQLDPVANLCMVFTARLLLTVFFKTIKKPKQFTPSWGLPCLRWRTTPGLVLWTSNVSKFQSHNINRCILRTSIHTNSIHWIARDCKLPIRKIKRAAHAVMHSRRKDKTR